jgi:hypothetical protein
MKENYGRKKRERKTEKEREIIPK